jgi:ATP-dependent helicase/nuclease subunit B
VTLFASQDSARVFALPPGTDFASALVAGLDARLAGQEPEAAARVTIWVNTRRAGRALAQALAATGPRLLPRIRALAELSADPLAPLDLAPPVPALRRKLDLARLVARLIEAEPGLAAETAAFDLADSLAELLDEMQGEGADPAALARLDAAEHAAHWQRSLRFLDLVTGYAGAVASPDGQGRLRAVAEAWAASWATDPPPDPVIVAGSTGSRAATRAFMAAIARLPQGALVLPGFDFDLPAPVWDRLAAPGGAGADHPQHGFRRLAAALGFDPTRVPRWTEAPPPAPERNALVSLALRPAPVTDQWRRDGTGLAGTLACAAAGLTWLEAPGPRAEARTIAFALREAAQSATRAALVTPDRSLARRVAAELDRWRLIPDDSAGRPLGLTPPGVLLRLLADLAVIPPGPAELLVLLKHPLVNSAPGARRLHNDLIERLEIRELRREPRPILDWDALAAWAADRGDPAPAWIAWLRRALAPPPDPATLETLAAWHRNAAEALAAGPAEAPNHALWGKDAGAAARAMLDEIAAEAAGYGPIAPAAFRALILSQLAGRDVPEEAVVTDPGIAIWGTLEARVQSAELVILAGLNEGTWPNQPGADPWLNRAMRAELGLTSPERRIGLAAHDFQQAMGAPRVVVSRATRDAEAPTVASRWLMRLENLLNGLGPEGRDALAAARSRGRMLLDRAAQLDRPPSRIPPARRPAPRPPAAARPAELSVTQLETLVRDPYAIYARHVLKLRKLDPAGRAPDALLRGSALHEALDAFVTATESGLPPDATAAYAQAVADALDATVPWPATRALWTARLTRVADWFVAEERTRRARGAPAAREVRGRRPLDAVPEPFTVTAKADRIDRTRDGSYAIYDYKSGGVPSDREARAFHLQLPLEGAIAAAGGFDGLPPGPPAHLELIGLNKRESRLLPADPAAIAEAWARLAELVAHYQAPEHGFVARLRPQRITYASDYDHLARYGEWGDGDEPEGGPEAAP